MQRLTTLALAVAAMALAATKTAYAQERKGGDKSATEAAALPNCPIMDEPVDFGVSTMTDEGPVYFCCEACIEKYTKEPAKYVDKVKAQRAALAKMNRVQVKCPLTGKPISKDAKVEADGQAVYFCCPKCLDAYKKEPAKYKAKLAASYTYQTKCPVSGEAIDPAAFVDLADGSRVYCCCTKCIEKLKADPGKYADKLAAQGTHLNMKKFEKK